MTTAEDLVVVREQITRRRKHATEVELCLAALKALHDSKASGSYNALVIRCDQQHQRHGRPKLAEAYRTELGVLFVSKIRWLPGDQLTLRPWLRQHLEGAGMDDATYQLAMVDDDLLRRSTEHNDAWARGLSSTGPRWLHKAPPTTILAMVRPDPRVQELDLWVRCVDHPAQAEALDPIGIIAATR